jgi:hypothetical protein
MTQSLAGVRAERAEAAVKAGDSERNRTAWNLPHGTADPTAHRDRGQLDWSGFLATHFPASGRHNLEAIVAYGRYMSSGLVEEADRGARPRARG